MSSNLNIRQAVGMAIGAAGAATASLAYIPLASAADTTGPTAETTTPELQEVIVTGTRVRRVDAETADPVLVLDQSTIAQSGAVTMGDLINRIPSIAGAAMNPALNNGGGFGESNIELRGLDAQRTLILIDGRRVNLTGSSGAVDVNQIPINLIDHVDVLKEGAGAIYGSDAIAGVVNFVTRKDVDGIELTGDWGESTKHDAKHHNLGAVWGTNTDKFSVQVGFNYNEQDELTMGARNWSKYALYLYSGSLFKAGSSRVPTGRIFLNSTTALSAKYGCASLTRIAGAAGTSQADFRCYNDPGDDFNFQPYNLNVTPQERGAMFSKVNYQVNDYVQFYGSGIYNHTHSGFQLAPLPFDSNDDEIVISKNNIYNPFGIDFGGGNAVGFANPDFTERMTSLGDRSSDTTSTSIISNVGVKGEIWTSGWNYDANLGYDRLDQVATVSGYFFTQQLTNAVGPSFYSNAAGASVPAGTPGAVPTCGTPAAPIANCTPINIFNPTGPGQSAALQSITAQYSNTSTFVAKTASLDTNGPIWRDGIGAGDILGSVGVDYTDLYSVSQVDAVAASSAATDYLACQISQEACSAPSTGGYNYKEGYVEIFLPLLKDVPFAKALNFDLGGRYSKYSIFGETTKGQFKVEYRPVRDLLVRGTVAQVFRAPTVADVSAGPAINSPNLSDPCNGYTGVPSATYPHLASACVGVLPNGTFQEPNGQVTGLVTSNPNLKPEAGIVRTAGFVYDPSYLRGFSMSVDYWDYYLNNLLVVLDPNYVTKQCATTGAQQFCSLLNRVQGGPNSGQFIYFNQPTANLGTLTTNGIDLSFKYSLRTGLIGDFLFTIDETHIMTYKNTPAPGAATQEIAGTFNSQFGLYTKDRGTATIGWSGWNAQALLTMRYIGSYDIPQTNEFTDASGNFLYYGGAHIGSVVYFDLTAGYTIKATNTVLRAGLLNVGDKIPPISGINAFAPSESVTDVFDYDTIGRRFFVGFTQKF